MRLVTLDFETFYTKGDYSLSCMTTEAYIRDPRFRVLGVGIKVDDGPTTYYTAGPQDVHAALASAQLDQRAVLCHNAAFDVAVLSWHYGIRPAFIFDTLSMARPDHALTCGVSLRALAEEHGLGKKGDIEQAAATGTLGAYCVQDIELTYALFKKLAQNFPASELKLIDLTIRMFTEPKLLLDVPLLEQHYQEEVARKTALQDTLRLVGEGKGMVMSNQKLADFLRAHGVEPPMKISKTTNRPTFAFAKTDKEFKALAEHPIGQVQIAVNARLGLKSTIEETRTLGLLSVARRGTLPILLNYYGAHSGRFSGGDKLNLQNLPRGGKLRQSLLAPPGYVIVAGDSSQIEARMLAYVAGQDDLVQAFRDKRDVYSEFATDVYGRPITKADKLERFVGKTCILGLGYSMSAARLRETLAIGQGGISVHIDEQEASRLVTFYRMKNFKIQGLWGIAGAALGPMCRGVSGAITPLLPYDGNYLTLPNGLGLYYPGLTPDGNGYSYNARGERTKMYGGKLVENIIQGLARIVVTTQMLDIAMFYPVVLTVHDEIVILAPEDEADAAKALLERVMSTPPQWAPDLPVACEVGYGKNYGGAK